MDAMQRMKNRVEDGRDPLTGEKFKTCPPHSVSMKAGECVCDGCGDPVALDEKGAWAHAEDVEDREEGWLPLPLR